jgi:flagellar biosynthesis protein FliR
MPLPDLSQLLPLIPSFVLTFFRVAGLMLFAPIFGSARVSRRVKVMIALVMAYAMVGVKHEPSSIPDDTWLLSLAIASEMALGMAMGLIVSLVFVGAQWAGEMIGQQVGFNMSQVFDPQMGGAGTIVGDIYYMLTLMIFLLLGGHRELVIGIHASLAEVPPGKLLFTQQTLDLVVGFLTTATTLAIRLAAPIFLTMIIVDVAMGGLTRTMPQLNIMSAGMSLRALLGMLLMVLGLYVASGVLSGALDEALQSLPRFWRTT